MILVIKGRRPTFAEAVEHIEREARRLNRVPDRIVGFRAPDGMIEFSCALREMT